MAKIIPIGTKRPTEDELRIAAVRALRKPIQSMDKFLETLILKIRDGDYSKKQKELIFFQMSRYLGIMDGIFKEEGNLCNAENENDSPPSK